jgi:hypothetical protein
MIPPIEVGKIYRIAGRSPVWIKQIRYGGGNRISVVGYTMPNYKKYMKFITYDTTTLKSIAEAEGLTEVPPTVIFRFNSKSKIEPVDMTKPRYSVAPRTVVMTTEEYARYLSKPRKEL